MSSYYLKAIILKSCPFSTNAYDLINKYKIPSDISIIESHEKEKYKTNSISTFPQIYLNRYNTKGNLLLGGYDDLNKFIRTFKNKELTDKNIKTFMETYKWSRRATLRFIELINNKVE